LPVLQVQHSARPTPRQPASISSDLYEEARERNSFSLMEESPFLNMSAASLRTQVSFANRTLSRLPGTLALGPSLADKKPPSPPRRAGDALPVLIFCSIPELLDLSKRRSAPNGISWTPCSTRHPSPRLDSFFGS